MGFMSLFLLGAAFLVGLFIAGVVFLIFGTVQKKNPNYAGKRPPSFYITRGKNYLIPPIIGALYLAYLLVSYFGEIRAQRAAIEGAIDELLTAADAGDRDSFEKIFTPNLQKKGNFGEAIDAFFESYPNGLSLCEREGRYGINQNHEKIAWTDATFTCFLDGEWYSMELRICYKDIESPDDVGVTFFRIENLEANALGRDYGKNEFLACEIVDESEVTARLINGKGYVFTPTPDRSITVEEMKSYLEKYDDFYNLTAQIGKPNASSKDGSTVFGYYYELVPENGEPRYVYVSTEGRKIHYSKICSDVGKISD